MWLDHGPALATVKNDYYTTNYFTDYAVRRVEERNVSKPFWLHLTYQAVHTGTGRAPPTWETWGGSVPCAFTRVPTHPGHQCGTNCDAATRGHTEPSFSAANKAHPQGTPHADTNVCCC